MESKRNKEDEAVNGPRIAAEILKRLPVEQQDRLVRAIEESSPQVAEKIETAIFDFAEIKTVPAQILQEALRQIDAQDVVTAMKAADPEVSELLIENMSGRKQALVRADLKSALPIPLSEAKLAQRRLLRKVHEVRFSQRDSHESKKHFLA